MALRVGRLFLLLSVPASIFCVVTQSLAQSPASTAKQGQYVNHDGTVTVTGPDAWLYINTFVWAQLTDANGNFSMKPTHLLIHNQDKTSCFVSCLLAGQGTPREVKANERWLTQLPVYQHPKARILKTDAQFKVWVGAAPTTIFARDLVAERELAEIINAYSDLVGRIKDLKEKADQVDTDLTRLFSGKSRYSERIEKALYVSLEDAFTALRGQKFGVTRESITGRLIKNLDAAYQQVNEVIGEVTRTVNLLNATPASAQPSQAPTGNALETLRQQLQNTLGKFYFVYFQPQTMENKYDRYEFLKEPGKIIRYARYDDNPTDYRMAEINIAQLDPAHITVNTEVPSGVGPVFSLYVNTEVPSGVGPIFLLQAKAGTSVAEANHIADQLRELVRLTKNPSAPVPKSNPKPVQPQLDANALNRLKQSTAQTQAKAAGLPKAAGTMSDLKQTPGPVGQQYARQMDALERRDVTAYTGTLAPDFFYKDKDGTVVPLSMWQAQQGDTLKTAKGVRAQTRVESVEQGEKAVIVTSVHAVVIDGKPTETKLRETWIERDGSHLLQSAEYVNPASTVKATGKLPPGFSAKIAEAERAEAENLKPKAARLYSEAWRLLPTNEDTAKKAIALWDGLNDVFESARIRNGVHAVNKFSEFGPGSAWWAATRAALIKECEERYAGVLKLVQESKLADALTSCLPLAEASPQDYSASVGVLKFQLGDNEGAVQAWKAVLGGPKDTGVRLIVGSRVFQSAQQITETLKSPAFKSFVADAFSNDEKNTVARVVKAIEEKQLYLDGVISDGRGSYNYTGYVLADETGQSNELKAVSASVPMLFLLPLGISRLSSTLVWNPIALPFDRLGFTAVRTQEYLTVADHAEMNGLLPGDQIKIGFIHEVNLPVEFNPVQVTKSEKENPGRAPNVSKDGLIKANLINAGDSKTVEITNTVTGKTVKKIRLKNSPAERVYLSPDGSKICAVLQSGSNKLELYDVKNGADRSLIYEFKFVYSAAWSDDGQRLAFYGRDDRDEPMQIIVLDVPKRDVLRRLHIPKIRTADGRYNEDDAFVTWLEYSPDGKKIAARSNGVLYLWEAESGKFLRRVIALPQNSVRFTPDSASVEISNGAQKVVLPLEAPK